LIFVFNFCLKRNRYYDLWFIVVLQDSVTNKIFIPKLALESDFLDKVFLYRSGLTAQFNSIQNSFQTNGTFYQVYMGNHQLRKLEESLSIHLNQSILHEDIEPIINGLISSLSIVNNYMFKVEYWGQNEFIRRSYPT
jgi:hypothetical protein